MARMDNAFALLGDEEGDDVTVLVEHIAKKVEVLSTHSKQDKELSAHSGQAEKVRDRGGQGRGTGRGRYWGNDDYQNGYRRNYYQDSYGYGEVDARGNGYRDRGRGRGAGYRGRSGGRGRGRGRGFNGEYGQQNVVLSNYNDGGEYQAEQDYAGWYDEQRMYRNGGRYSSGERRGRGYRGQYHNDDVEQANGDHLTGDDKYGDEEMANRNTNWNYGYDRRGYGGKVGRSRREFRRADNVEVKESGFGDDADKSKAGSGVIAETAEKKILADGNQDGAETNPGVKSRKLSEEEERMEKEKEERRQRREEERKKEAMLMTLDQYEEMLLEKRKALEAQKAEERKVTVDKELEGMQLVKKKEDVSIIKLKSEEKMKKKDNLEKEKARKLAPEDIAGFLKPTSYRGGGREFGGGSDEGGFRRQQFSLSRDSQTNDGGREQYIGDEGNWRGRYSSRGRGRGRGNVNDQGGSRGGNSYRGGRTSNAGREQSRGGRGGITEVGSRGQNPAQGRRANDDVDQRKAAAAAANVNPYDKDFPVLGAKPSSVPAATSTTIKA